MLLLADPNADVLHTAALLVWLIVSNDDRTRRVVALLRALRPR